LPDAQRQAVYELVGGFAQISQVDKGFWYQMAESLGRGASTFTEAVPRNFREQSLRGDLRLLQSEQPVFRAAGAGGSAFSAAGQTPVTPEEREEAKTKIEADLGVLKVERELRDLAERVVDPIKTVTFLPEIVEEGLYGAARSIPYTAAAAVPYAGVPAVASALFSSNYDRIMLEYPDLDPDKAALLAAISAPIEAGLERMKVNTIMGRLPIVAGLVKRLQHPNQRNITRIAIGGVGVLAEQNAQEILQNATFPFVQTIAAALDQDIPEYKLDLASMPRDLAVQFVALLPLSLMGVGALSYREISRGENYLKSKADLEKAGYNEEQIDRITGAESAEAAQAALVEEHAKRDPKLVKAAAQRIVDESIALREKANPAALPRLEKQGADYVVLSPEGKELARTTDQTAAEQALVSARRETVQREMRDVHTGINEAVAFIQKVNEARQRGEDVAKVIREEAPRTLLTDYEANPTQENLDRLFETVRAFGQDINEPAELANFPVIGSNQGALAEGIWRSVIRINEGADGTIVMREFAQDNLKRAIAEGRTTLDFVRQQLNDILPQIDSDRMERKLRTETDTDVIEAFSDIAVAYFRGSIREEQIPAGLRGIMRRLAIFTRDIFRRAYNLARLRAEGKLDRDFEALLAEAVGVDQQALVDRARERTEQEVGAESVDGVSNYSIAAEPSRVVMGININDSAQDFTGQILRGEKTIETRATQSLNPYVGKRVGIVRTGVGRATLVGYATIGQPITYLDEASFRDDESKHRVSQGSEFDIGPEGKFGYPLLNVESTDPKEVVARGIVARSLQNYSIGLREPDAFRFNEQTLPNGNVRFIAYHGSEQALSEIQDQPIYVSSMSDGAGYGAPTRVIVEGKFVSENEIEAFAAKYGIAMEDLFHEEASMEQNLQEALRAEGYDGAMYYDQRRDDGEVVPAAIIVNPSAITIRESDDTTEAGTLAPDTDLTTLDPDQQQGEGWQDIPWEQSEKNYSIAPAVLPEAFPILDKALYDQILAETDTTAAIHIDRLRVGEYEGVMLQGGMYFPAIVENLKQGVVWAFNSKSVASAVAERARANGGYVKLVLMLEGNVIGNKTFATIWFKQLRKNIKAGKITTEQALAEINAIRERYVTRPVKGVTTKFTGHDKPFTTLKQAEKALMEMPQIKRGNSYFKKTSVVTKSDGEKMSYQSLLSQAMTAKGFPDAAKIVESIEEPAFKGLPKGTIVGLIKIDPNAVPMSAAEAGVTEHISYGYVLKGKPVARMAKHQSIDALYPQISGKLMSQQAMDFPASQALNYSIGSRAQPDVERNLVTLPDVTISGPANYSIRAWHGSPAEFEEFLLDFIGTGEGAQVYGWGLYFAEMQGVARKYRENLAGRSSFDSILVDGQPIDSTDETQQLAEQAVVGPLIGNGDVQKAIAALEQADNLDPVAQWLKERADRITIKPEEFKGALYEVDIDTDEDLLLDWDKPFDEQPAAVKQALGWLKPVVEANMRAYARSDMPMSGSLMYVMLAQMERQKGAGTEGSPEQKASQVLLERGIKGIRYLDQASRGIARGKILGIWRGDQMQMTNKPTGKWFARIQSAGQQVDGAPESWTTSKPFDSEAEARQWAESAVASDGTYNYVIFDDSLIKILTRNGEQISVEQAAQEAQNYSISTQREIDRVGAAMDRLARSPSERVSQYAALKERLAAALERNKPIMQSMRGDTLPQDFDRTRILNDLGFLDYILKVLPPEVRGRVGGYTNLASIAPVDVYKGDQKVSEAKNPAGAIISAWMREGQNIGQAQKNTALPEGYSTVPNTTDERRDKTIANFLIDRLKKIDRELERYYKRDLMERIFDVLDKSRPKAGDSGVKRSTLGAETQKFADMVYRASLLDDEQTAERLAAIEAAITSTESSQDSQKRISELSEEWTIVNTFGDLKNRPSETMAYGLEWLQGQLKAGREAWNIKETARIEENRQRVADALVILGKPTDKGRFENPTALKRFLQSINALDLDHKSFEQFATIIFGDKLGGYFSEKLRQADINAAKAELENTKKILKSLREGAKAAGISTGKALVKFKREESNVIRKLEGRKVKNTEIAIDLAKKIVRGMADRGSLSKADVETLADELASLPRDTKKIYVTIKQVIYRGDETRISMNRATAMQLWLSWQQSDIQEKMRREGWNDDSAEDLENLLSDPVSQAILKVTRSVYGGGYALTNPIYSRMFGMNMPMVKNYAPARFLNAKEVKDVGLDGTPLTAGGQPSFAKSRVTHSAKIANKDGLTVLQSHIAQQAHWVAFAELTREYRSLLSNPEVRDAITQRYGEDVLTTADMWAEQMEQRGGNKGREIGWINNMLGAAIGGQSVSLLGFNLKSLMMQTDNLMRFSLALDSRQIASAMSDPAGLMRAIRKVWKTDLLQTRLEGGATAETRFLFSRFISMFRRGAKISELAMMPMNYADSAGLSISGAIVYQAAYKDAVESGMTEQMADQAAKDAVEAMIYRYGQPVLMGQKSNIENSGNVFAKTFFLFMSDPRLKTALLADSIRGLSTGQGNWKDHVRRIVAVEMMAIVSHVLATAFRDATSDDDDEDLWSMGGFARALLLAPLQGYFLVGSVSEVVLSRLTEARWFTPTQNPFIRTADTAFKAFNNLDDAFNFDDPDALVKEWTNITRSIALAPPLAAPAVIMNLVRPLVQGWERMDDDQ
jgi:hypothetical protein